MKGGSRRPGSAYRITVIVCPGAKTQTVIRTGPDNYRVSVRAPAREGKANDAVRALLAKHLKIPLSGIWIVRGKTSRIKILEVLP